MKKFLLASAAIFATASASPAAETTAPDSISPPGDAIAPGQEPTAPRFPGFGANLANGPQVNSPAAWEIVPSSASWTKLANSTPETRQQARWDYARSLIGSHMAGEALGVLDVMLSDDPNIALVAAYGLARGVTLEMLGRSDEALGALSLPALNGNAEACAWRLRALGDAHRPAEALGQIGCALPAMRARHGADLQPFVLSAADSALAAGRPELAMRWLTGVPDSNPGANLLRGRALSALGRVAEGRLRFAQAGQNGNLEQKVDARLSAIEAGAMHGGVPAKAALKRLDSISYTWRGGAIEERTLKLSYALATRTHDLRGSLAAGAGLFRYFRLDTDDQAMLSGLQASLLAALSPNSGLPIDQAAGIYWDFRDLTPAGSAGDYLVSQLGQRLEAAGLYGRAAELLEHQLLTRTTDIAQGPLSTRVATLHILAGQPARAIDVLRKTDNVPYPADMLAARHRVEAVALTQLGKASEALAILQSVPDGEGLRAEIYWRNHDWAGLAASPILPKPGQLDGVAQTVLLRQAIALAMLGREPALARLRARYAAAFAKAPSKALFDILTRPAKSIDPALLGKAMAGLPTASPAGDLADLLDAQMKTNG